jgi:hypothetical protein
MSKGHGYHHSNDRAQRELGLNLRQLAALCAAVSSALMDGGPTCRRWVNTVVATAGQHDRAGDELLTLFRRGLLVEVARIENDVFYKPTASAIDKVRGWAGAHRRGEAAAE